MEGREILGLAYVAIAYLTIFAIWLSVKIINKIEKKQSRINELEKGYRLEREYRDILEKRNLNLFSQLEKIGRVKVSTPLNSVDPQIGQRYWHIHHEVLQEKLTEPVQNRINAIRRKSESPARLFTRLFLMRPLTVPPEYLALEKAYERATANQDLAYQALRNHTLTSGGYDTIKAKTVAIGTALINYNWNDAHKAQCDPQCPWDGKTIFPAGSVA